MFRCRNVAVALAVALLAVISAGSADKGKDNKIPDEARAILEKAEQGELAEIIVLEEIEKVQPLDNLLPLVSIMGSGYLAKMNAHVGNRGETTNVLVLATCNDERVIR